MKWKNRLTNYNFWISIVSAILLICQALKLKFDVAYINEIVTAVLGLLVVIGIINDPTKSSSTSADTSTKDKSTKSEENAIPNDQKDASNFDFSEDNLQVLLNKIKEDLAKSNSNFSTLQNGEVKQKDEQRDVQENVNERNLVEEGLTSSEELTNAVEQENQTEQIESAEQDACAQNLDAQVEEKIEQGNYEQNETLNANSTTQTTATYFNIVN